MNLNKLAALMAITLISPYGAALESDFNQPIHVSSVKQHAKLKTNTLTFTDEVLLTQGSIKITADKLTVIRGTEPNHEIMIAEGNVASFHQIQDDGKPLDAEAKTIRYDVAQGKITLTENAQVKQLDSKITGTKIIYYIGTEELNVTTDQSKQERVKTVFLPSQFEKDSSKEESNVKETNTEDTPSIPVGKE
ncbi:lipopolysaccharide transport periplasmic protein LptA [Psychromonas algicola]|uniref:lipopolysaccharide transport periplasmic protein LptA n=1 Tax=Psychromonas algicola TaxID=2555642 RepID=UPI0010684255|nr:lipopolysaccharide transport periplasmic protein LptA [Psychromonas sp. RZ5]TEW51405.1 lipopolysaccharide transport periplasmic protein LptA [Psychromonas sp. RZ5]